MLVFNNQQRSGYEEIASYGPKYYLSNKEMDAVYRFAGWTLDLMAEDLDKLIVYQFVSHMNEECIARMEVFLGIHSEMSMSLEERKSVVGTEWNSSGKLSAEKIRQVIVSLIGSSTEIDISFKDSFIITVNELEAEKKMNNVLDSLLKKLLPAHLDYAIIYQNPIGGYIYVGGVMQQADIINIRQVI